MTSDPCTDLAGNTASGVPSADFKIDKTAPVITDDGPTTLPNSNGWYNTNVTNEFSLDAGISGPNAACALAFPGNAQSKTTSGEGFAVSVTSDPCTDLAGNTASGVPSADFQIDKTDPVVAIASPGTGYVTVASSVVVNGTASDSTSGIEKVNVNGGPNAAYTAPNWTATVPLACGTNTISAVATDLAGRTSTASITVTRVCAATLQYYQPIDQTVGSATPVINTGKMGRVIPVKVTGTLSLGGTPVAMTESFLNANNLTLRIGVN